MSRLEPILDQKRATIAKRAARATAQPIARRADQCRSLREAIQPPGGPHLIAELKRRTPTIPVLREPFEPVRLAQEYAAAGASAISIVIDEPFFDGRIEWIQQVRDAVALPVLAKDFVLDPCQVDDAALAGADALLLIADIVPETLLTALIERCIHVGLEPLVEIHTEASLERAIRSGAPLIGINNRDLQDFTVDRSTALRLAPRVPRDIPVVAESGISAREEIIRLGAAGVHAVLIGEALLKSPDIVSKINELLGRSRP